MGTHTCNGLKAIDIMCPEWYNRDKLEKDIPSQKGKEMKKAIFIGGVVLAIALCINIMAITAFVVLAIIGAAFTIVKAIYNKFTT